MRSEAAQFKTSALPEAVYPRLAHLEHAYPNFANWFWKKCAPGVANGSRFIFAQSSGNTFAAVIAKKDLEERKLCTVYISDKIKNRGIGTQLIVTAMRWLECEKPLLTVPEEKLQQFVPILRRLDFRLDQIVYSCYRTGRREYVFNGRLDRNSLFKNSFSQSGSVSSYNLAIGDRKSLRLQSCV